MASFIKFKIQKLINPTFFRSDIPTIILLTCLAFFTYLMFLQGIYQDLYSDSVLYMSMARGFLEGNFGLLFHPLWPPFYPFISALFYLVFQDWLLSARMVSLIFGTLLVIPIFLLTRSLLKKTDAVLAVIILIYLKPLVISNTAPLSETLAIFCFWSGFYLLWVSLARKPLIAAVLAGIFFGLTYLTRVEGIFAVIGSFVFVLICFSIIITLSVIKKNIPLNSLSIKGLLTVLISMFLGFALVYAPYNLGMQYKYKESLLLGKAAAIFNSYGGVTKFNRDKTSTWAQDVWSLETFNPRSEFLIYDGYKDLEQRKVLISDAITRVKIFFQKYLYNYFGLFGIVLASAGLIYFCINRIVFFLYSMTMFLTMFFGMSFFATQAEARFVYLYLPFFIIYIFAAIKLITSVIGKNQMIVQLLLVVLIVVLSKDGFIFLHTGPPNTEFMPPDAMIPLVKADEWFTSFHPGSIVMAGHERIVFNSKGLLIFPPNTQNQDDFFKYARLKNVDFIVAIPGEIPALLEYLYKDPKDYPGIKLIYSYPEYNVYIYRFLMANP